MTEPTAEPIQASITVTAKSTGGGGMLLSLSTSGHFSGENVDRRFYSVPSEPPRDLPPQVFWGVLLTQVAEYLSDPE